MAIQPTFVMHGSVLEQINTQVDKIVRERFPGDTIVGGPGTVVAPDVTIGPIRIPTDQGIDKLDFPHVRPGDLITAEFVNRLIDVVVDIDSRLQRIEILAARAIKRDEDKDSPPQGKP